MISLSFTLPAATSPWRKTWETARQSNPALISEIDLRYKYFSVNVEMIAGGVEVVSKRRFLTLVDLALSFAYAERRISSGEDATFGFTESEETIHLCHEGEVISVTSSRWPWRASAERVELTTAFSDFLRKAHSCLVEEIPELAANPVIRQIAPE